MSFLVSYKYKHTKRIAYPLLIAEINSNDYSHRVLWGSVMKSFAWVDNLFAWLNRYYLKILTLIYLYVSIDKSLFCQCYHRTWLRKISLLKNLHYPKNRFHVNNVQTRPLFYGSFLRSSRYYLPRINPFRDA